MPYQFFNNYLQTKKGFKFLSLLVAILLVVAVYKIYADCFSPNVKGSKNQSMIVLVPSTKNFDRFCYDLDNKGVVENIHSFRRFAKLLNLDEKLKPGRYKVEGGMSNFDFIKLLLRGSQEAVNLVFNYAERAEDLSSFFGRNLELDSIALLNILKNNEEAKLHGFDTNTFVSMFIPNTYNFYWNTNSIELIKRMDKEYKKFWTQERLAKSIHQKLSQAEVSTLASIVQKESNKEKEMPVIAGVYLNRLRKGIPLQADPTVIFAWNDKEIRRVSSVHTSIQSPYNTYMNAGLPPGPICVPSIQAIDAVLNAEEHGYYYFCAREDFSGYHSFAATFQQHQVNARRYQQALNRNGIQ
jgi:UPF0755 protein